MTTNGTREALLVIADIRGYTPFMKAHWTSLAHAQDVVGRLLEAVIDAAPALTPLEIEGDAAFFYAWSTGAANEAERLVEQVVAMHRAFHARQQEIATLNGCRCEGCRQVGRLHVKFVADVGEVAVQRVKRSAKLAGLGVIRVHRMLKTAVPVSEYLLLTDSLFEASDGTVRAQSRGIEDDLPGLGPAAQRRSCGAQCRADRRVRGPGSGRCRASPGDGSPSVQVPSDPLRPSKDRGCR